MDQSPVGDALPRREVRGGSQFCDCLRLHGGALPYGDPKHSRGGQLLLWQDRGDHRTSDSAPRHRLDSVPAPDHGHRLPHRGHPRIRLPPGDSREEASVVNARSSQSLKRNVCRYNISVAKFNFADLNNICKEIKAMEKYKIHKHKSSNFTVKMTKNKLMIS